MNNFLNIRSKKQPDSIPSNEYLALKTALPKRLGRLAVIISVIALFGLSNVQAAGAHLDPSFNTGTMLGRGFITKLVIQPDGKTLIGGSFTIANGSARNNLVRVNADGSLDSSFNTGTGPNSIVRAIALRSDGKIIIAGSFTSVNGVARNRIARLNPDGSLDTSFDPGTGASGSIYAVTQVPGFNVIYIAGAFSIYNGTARTRVALLNDDGSLNSFFNLLLGPNSLVYDMKLQADGKPVICGAFTSVGGMTRRRVARFNTDGSLDTTFTPSISIGSGNAYALALQSDGKILVGGYLSDASFNSIALLRLNPNGSLDNSFNSGTWPAIASVQAIALQSDGKIVAGGRFRSLNGRRNIARFNADGSLDQAFFPGAGANADVWSIALLADGKMLIGGDFYHFNGNTNDIVSVVKLNTDGSADSSFSFSTRLPGAVYDLAALPNGKTIIAGHFLEINGHRQYNVARLNSDGSLDTTFNPLYGTDGYWVNSVAVKPDGKLIIGGLFTDISYTVRDNIAQLNADGSLDSSFSTSADQEINIVKLQPDGKILIGGFFFNVNGSPTSDAGAGLARLNADGNVDTSFAPDTDLAIALIYNVSIQPDGKIIIGGLIYNSSFALLSMRRLNANGSVDTSFNVGSGVNGYVLSAALQPDGKVVIGGTFTSVNGTSRNRIARLNADGSLDNSFNPGSGANSDIWSIAVQSDGKILVGGYFTSFNGVSRTGLVRLRSDGSLDSSFNPGISSGGVEAIGFQPDGKILIGGYLITPNSPVARLVLASAPFDFDGDSKTDLAVFRPSNGYWYISQSSDNAFRAVPFGSSGDLVTPGDYDGDGKTDTAVFRPSNGYWYILNSSDGSFRPQFFGQAGDIPAAGDYDGDGKADISVYRPSNNYFYLLYSSDNSFHFQQWGQAGDQPVMGDYDGDGKTDFAIFRPAIGTFYILQSSNGAVSGQQFGANGDKPIAGDFDGDGKTDIAVFRPSMGAWYILNSSDNSVRGLGWGSNGDLAVAGDYDGDGKWDVAVFRPSSGTFYVLQSASNSLRAEQFGANGDVPVPSAYVQ